MVGGVGPTKKWSVEHVWISDSEEEEEEEVKRGFRVLFYGRREEDTLLDEVPVLQLDNYRSSSPCSGYVSRFEID